MESYPSVDSTWGGIPTKGDPRKQGVLSVRTDDHIVDACERLHMVIEHLYVAFSEYHLDQVVRESPIWPQRSQHLSRPLREFTSQELPDWVWKSGDEWGFEEEYKYFAPKVLELLAFGELGFWSEIALGRLAVARWMEWPSSEQDVVRDYIKALWTCTLAQFRSPYAGQLLNGIAMAQEDIWPYMEEWRKATSGASLRHLAQFITSHYRLLEKKRLGDFWDQCPAGMNRVLEWLLNPDRLGQLESGFFMYQYEPFATELSIAHDQLDWLQRTWRSRWNAFGPRQVGPS